MANGTLTLNIDRGEFIARLTRAKVSKQQAEAFTDGLEKDMEINPGDLVTEGTLDIKFNLLEERMTRKMYQAHVISLGITAAIVGIMMTALGFVIVMFG